MTLKHQDFLYAYEGGNPSLLPFGSDSLLVSILCVEESEKLA